MNQYVVKLKDNDKEITVKADGFFNNLLGHNITFVNKENKLVALFYASDVQYINMKQKMYLNNRHFNNCVKE